ncbi:hydrogen peroxide-inducible genes activator [Tabrizicola sp.]|uniref:hydrogen peroxide-inducible genes activator n=1 Tax=Tabrizicola sp. TaxID=2005166 RepID=UPI000BC69CA7|nr:hydrogen peroxide-inducible genes activator [Tabrizicola sp.]MBY0351419.1 LysR family transcriptional regulator [Tabrizicola sp.]MDK2773421.1 LysR family transcriptional regulator [Tabrizicola sp.]OYX18974.1 MAG: LysR family transcriptional regulator [Rhodobacterales bacterium 32-66-9]
MTRITLKHLRYFDALARQRHFGRAAEVSAISQPALSLQMKELEDILGAPLVERGARQIGLTPLGEEFALRARDVLRAVDELGALARASSGPLAGRLRLGVIPTVAPYLLPRLMRVMSGSFPEIDLRPREAVTPKLLRDLHEGRLDLAILALPVGEPSLVEDALFDEEFLLVRHESAQALPVPLLVDLPAAPLLLLEEGHCLRDQAIAACKMPSGPSGEIMEGSSLSTLVQMVGAGIGVTLIPQMAAEVEGRSAPVVLHRLPEPRPKRTIGLVWRRSNPLSDRFAGFAAGLKAAMNG